MTLVLDARTAARGIIYAHETIPVKTGAFTLVYPQWIPGEHGPTGPLSDLAALRVSAGSTPLTWHRDDVDMYAFHVDVPPGVTRLNVDFDVILNAVYDVMSTNALAIVNWNRALLYQDGVDAHQYFVKPSIELPAEWQYATALRETAQKEDRIDFATASLSYLVDSPLDMGRYVKKWTLWKSGDASVELDAFADMPGDLAIPDKLLAAYGRVPEQAFALYGSRHFANYHALLVLSDNIGFQGIEHHQSSDDRAPDDFLTSRLASLTGGDLITHEFSHSWNGKYRRPADLTTPNFQVPQHTDLLWVYEGLNQYLGDVLAFRSGIRDPKTYPERLAAFYAQMAYEPGRSTTPLIELTTGAPYLYPLHAAYPSIRRTAGDFYTEGELLWLDVDTIIRERSHGTRSLDTFLHRYTLPRLTGPVVLTYTREQIESLLNEVEPYDWHGFFQKYVYNISRQPPTDELARSGWHLVWSDKPNLYIAAAAKEHYIVNRWYGLGITLSPKGIVRDVREGSPAWNAGIAEGSKIVAIDGHTVYDREDSFDVAQMDYALRSAEHSSQPIGIIVEDAGWYRVLAVNYHDGLRYPHLERTVGASDMLAAIMAPKTGSR
jgi:predicted metalloprotease with PDZ domain